MRGKLGQDGLATLILALLAVALHACVLTRYGYFRDELYYLACARRPDWGYVDHPSLSVLLLKAWTGVFGTSLASVRAPVMLASGATVALIVATSRRMGVAGWGVWLAGVMPLLAGMYLVVFHMYTMNAHEILLWSWAAWLTVRLLEEQRLTRWIWLGVVFALGLHTKASMAWLMVSLILAIGVSSHRRILRTPGPWVALGLGVGLWAPHLVWQARHDWPTLEFIHNAQLYKMVPVSPLDFLGQQAVVMNLATLPLFVLGAWFGLSARGERRWSPFAIVFLLVLALLLTVQRSRVNYLAPAYAWLLPLAAYATWTKAREWSVRPIWILPPVILAGALTIPLGLPILPVSVLADVVIAVRVEPPVEETGPKAKIQGYADMFGWPEMTQAAERAFRSLPEPDRRRAVIYCHNYGQASAIEHFWSLSERPRVISGHNSFGLWGPGEWTGEVAVMVNVRNPEIWSRFSQWTVVEHVDAQWAMPEENGAPIAIARGMRIPVPEFWSFVRRYI